MEPLDRRSDAEPPFPRHRAASFPASSTRKSSSRTRTPASYRICDAVTAGLILFMMIFTPWAFGTTEKWSTWTMNLVGFLLGGLLLAKRCICRATGFSPMRWGEVSSLEGSELIQIQQQRRDTIGICLAGLTVFMLIYILIGTVNARATFIEAERRFVYRDCITWLPHSYDATSSWFAFWTATGLACFFWATRDWLMTKGAPRQRRHKHERHGSVTEGHSSVLHARRESIPTSGLMSMDSVESAERSGIPKRLRLLLWVLCVSSALLALEAILQRLSGTSSLLWLRVPWYNTAPESQFGPYAYRANAASYFNLVWPVCLGFWMALRQHAGRASHSGTRVGAGSHMVLLPGAVLMAACPIISTTRGGTLIAFGNICIMLGVLLWSTRKESVWFRTGACLFFVVILTFSGVLGLRELAPRFRTIFSDQMSHRVEIYGNALPIARDFPLFGTGAGTFGSLYQLYRTDPSQPWEAYAHDDWLEMRITLGWVGLSTLVLMLGLAFVRPLLGRGIAVPWEFRTTLWMALVGCLLHAKFDFPMQVYSILFLFLLLCAILVSLGRSLPRS